MTPSFRSGLLAPLACLLAACTETVGEARAPSQPPGEVRIAERGPRVAPERVDGAEYHWLQALDRTDIGDEVAIELGDELLEGRFELRLEDLHVELWHEGAGARGARRLLEGLRNCDRDASIRFGRTQFVKAGELDPPSEWPLELRYLESDAHGLPAAELLRDHLRTSCDGDARELVREIVDRHGLVLRPAAEFAYAEDPRNRIPLVLVLSPRTAVAEGSDL